MPPQLTFDELSYRIYRGPTLAAEGSAARASLRRDTSDLAAERVTVRFPPTGERAEAHLTTARATGNLRERTFHASGGVRAEQADQVAVTSEASYEAARGVVHGEQPIEVRGGSRLTVRGPGFTLYPREQRLRVEGGARIVAGEERR